jgi:ketosteroid isomerase-like protein
MSLNRQTALRLALIGIAVCVAGLALAGGAKDFGTISEEWGKRYNARDAAGVADLYAEDGVIMPPKAKSAKGRAAIAAYLEKDMAEAPGELVIETAVHDMSGELGFSQGHFWVKDADGNVVDEGKWLEVRRKIQGEWKIIYDIWNSDNP